MKRTKTSKLEISLLVYAITAVGLSVYLLPFIYVGFGYGGNDPLVCTCTVMELHSDRQLPFYTHVALWFARQMTLRTVLALIAAAGSIAASVFVANEGTRMCVYHIVIWVSLCAFWMNLAGLMCILI